MTVKVKQDRWPAYQNMISFQGREEISNQHARGLELFDATCEDCDLYDMEDIPEYEVAYKQNMRTRYRCRWTTYKGWRVYMYMTGCIASIPGME